MSAGPPTLRTPPVDCANDNAEARSQDARVARALALMTADPARPWTVAALARATASSRAAFARRFAEALGVGPIGWLSAHRLRLAARRLEEGDARLAQIAAEVGYASEFALGKAFKRRFGVSPGAFRRAREAGGSMRVRAAA